MKKFLLLYKSKHTAEEQMKNASSDQGKESMEIWGQWFQKAGSAIVDMGAPTGNETHVSKSSDDAKQDMHVGGYTIVQAEDMDAVKSMIENHPHFMQEGNCIEVLELLPVPGM